MTVLTETLERLEYWLLQHHPLVAESLKPGLTVEEIDNQVRQVQDLPFHITQEIEELYQWANGWDLFFTPFHDENLGAMPLEEAIQYSYAQPTQASWVVIERVDIPNLVMFHEFERWVHFAVCDEDDSSPILVITDDDYTRLAYSSITSMVLTTLECYEREILKIDYDQAKSLIANESLLKEFNFIRRRNNAAFDSESIRERYSIQLE